MASPNEPINPFEAARQRGTPPDILVEWSVADLQKIRPDWSNEQCTAFLRRHQTKFAAGILRLGLHLLESMSKELQFGGTPLPHAPDGDHPLPPEKS